MAQIKKPSLSTANRLNVFQLLSYRYKRIVSNFYDKFCASIIFFSPFHSPNNLYLHKEASCPCTEVGCPWVVGPCASGLPLVSAPWAAASEGRGCRCLCWRSGGHSVVFLSGSAGMKIEAMVDLCWVTAAAWRHARLLPSSSRHLQRKTLLKIRLFNDLEIT